MVSDRPLCTVNSTPAASLLDSVTSAQGWQYFPTVGSPGSKKRGCVWRAVAAMTGRLGAHRCHELQAWAYFYVNPVAPRVRGCKAQHALNTGGTLANKIVYVAHRHDGDRGLFAGHDLMPRTIATLYGGQLRRLIESQRLVATDSAPAGAHPSAGDMMDRAAPADVEGDEGPNTHVRHLPGNDIVALDGLPFANWLPPKTQRGSENPRLRTHLFPECEDQDLHYLIANTGVGYMARTVTDCPRCPKANVSMAFFDVYHPAIGLMYTQVAALVVGTMPIPADGELIRKHEGWKSKRKYPCKETH
jgi:hypothetical protein